MKKVEAPQNDQPKRLPATHPAARGYRVLQSYQMFDDMLAWQEAYELVKEVE